jgi:asparagine synthase (glutamine-hydrolysing)
MCGIAGALGFDLETREVLRHRGPDAFGRVDLETPAGKVSLLHSRLAIVDLSSNGEQPISDEKGRFVVVFNGEIYNHLELRRLCESRGHRFRSRMDGETIVHLWEDEGPACLARLNGIFAICVVDTTTGEMFLARDPFGVKPLFVAEEGDGIVFASEPSTLLELGVSGGGTDVVALAQFLAFLWIPAPRTQYKNIRALLPGRVTRYRRGETPRTTVFNLPLPTADMQTGQRLSPATDMFNDLLRRSVGAQLLGDVPVGIMASGGIDSSLLWVLGERALDPVFTIEWDSSAEGSNEDAVAVRAIAAKSPVTSPTFISGDATSFRYNLSSGDLFADPAYELTRQISSRARNLGCKVLLSGQGGDEIFGGYRRHLVANLLDRYPKCAGDIAKRLIAPAAARAGEYPSRLGTALTHRDPLRRYLELCTYSDSRDRSRILGVSESEVSDDVVLASHRSLWDALDPKLSYLRKCLALDLAIYLPGLGLSYVDRASMEFGVEVRVPFLDLDLVRWSFTLPDQLLVKNMRGKVVPTNLAKQLVPVAANRKKRGFGAPASSVAVKDTASAKGFRQSNYLTLATSILHERNLSVPQTT